MSTISTGNYLSSHDFTIAISFGDFRRGCISISRFLQELRHIALRNAIVRPIMVSPTRSINITITQAESDYLTGRIKFILFILSISLALSLLV